MPGSELSLRHLPDLSDASFSFQIPVDSGDDLLRADSDDFFGGGASLLASPSRANDAPLTLGDLAPAAHAVLKPKESKKVVKSLLPTTRPNIHALSGSQIASKVPKPVSTTNRKPKQVIAVPDEIPAESTPIFPGKSTPGRGSTTINAPNEISPPAIHPSTDEFEFDDFDKTRRVSAVWPSFPVLGEPDHHATVTAPDATADSTSLAVVGDSDTGGITARLLMYGAQMISSFPQSDNDDSLSHHGTAAQGDAAMPDNALPSETHDTAETVVSAGDTDNALSSSALSDGEIIHSNNRMVVDSETDLGSVAPRDESPVSRVPEPSIPIPAPRDDPLTLSQLSPRKTAIVGDDGNVEKAREGTVSPMRPSVKRPSSATSADVEPGVRSKKQRAPSAPSVPAARRGTGAARPVRGRGGARVVSAPAQVRVARQPVRNASSSEAPAKRTIVASQRAATSTSTRPRIAAVSVSAAPKIIKTKAKVKLPDTSTVAVGSSSSGNNLPGTSTVGSSTSNNNASTRNATASVQISLQTTTGVPGEEEQTQSRPKPYTIPNFKAMHASLAAQGALRRSQLAPTVPVPIAFSTDIRAKERELFDEKMREKEREVEAVKEVQRLEREEEEARELKELRKRAIPKAHEVPEWYQEAPKRNHEADQ